MRIVLTGSVAFDYLMSFPGYFRDHILPERLETISLSFLVESMVRLRGGVAPNIAYTLALLHENPMLWAAVGEDFCEYREYLDKMGIDTSGARVIPGVYTASFFANTDRANNQIASFYPGAMAYASTLSLHELIEKPDIVVISPNDPKAMVLYVRQCKELQIPYIYDPSQQIVRLGAGEIQEGIDDALALFLNDYESALVEKATGLDPVEIVNRKNAPKGAFVVVTRGSQGVDIYDRGGKIHIPVVTPMQILDPTGVGDAFRGGFLTGLAHRFDLLTCGRMGTLAATYCLEQRGPQGHYYRIEDFIQRFRENFEDNGALNELVR